MQLHACLLLFIITTDKTLALLHRHCGGNVSLDKEPAGHINLTLPGRSTDTNHTSSPMICTWTIGIPLGRTVLLKPVWLESGSSISVHCVLNEEGQKVTESGRTALLSHCYTNKATLTWTGEGRSSHEIQLFYYVQEDERNSSVDHTSPHSDLSRWSQTGTSFASTTPVGREEARWVQGGRGRLYEGLKRSSGTQSASSPSSEDQGLLHPTSPLQGLTVAVRADRETLSLPEEEPNNGADTSGAAPLADGKMSIGERTHPYFQYTLSTDALFHTEIASSSELHQMQTQAAASSFNTLLGTDKYTATQTSKPSITTQAIPDSSSSPPELPSQTSWENGTVPIRRDGAVSGTPGEKVSPSWRSQRSTDSDLTSTFDPLKSPQQDESSSAYTDAEPTVPSSPSPSPSSLSLSSSSSSSPSQGPSETRLSSTHVPVEAASFHPNISKTDSSVSAASDVTSGTAAFESSSKNMETLHTFSTQSQTNKPQSTRSPPPDTSSQKETQTATHQHFTNTISSSPDITYVDDFTSDFMDSSSTPRVAPTFGDVLQDSAPTGATTDTETSTPHPLLHDHSPSALLLSSTTSTHSSTPSLQIHTTLAASSHFSLTPSPLLSTTTESAVHTPLINHETMPTPSQTQTVTSSHTPKTQETLPSSTNVPLPHKQPHNNITTAYMSLLSLTTVKPDHRPGVKNEGIEESWQWFPSITTTQTPTTGDPSWTTPHRTITPSVLTSTWSSTTTQTPKFYIVPDQPATIRVESIELLLQIIVEESRSDFTSGLEEETAAWVEPYLQKAPGFSRLLGVWRSGHAVQSLVEFKTSGALQWLSRTGPTSLLERTGLAQAVGDRKSFRSSRITNITLGGVQGDVCDWLLKCPAGYKCVFQPDSSNYSCSSDCHFEYCHHHGICTHHPVTLPVCRCLVGEDFWYMGQRCDVRMTRARLVGACLAILIIMVTVIGVLALVAVRRYRAILIQAKVDQTRSSYRRFNHFDELSGRFWLRSWAGSADSLDNPAFTRSDELLHLRALDRPCCYHDDTLSLASTCPSHGTRINTIYPHSSQYGWRGSEMSMGDGVLDSGKASDLSVCSWPVEPIQWTPFPLLQQLASHRTPTVRMSRPRSYCEGMELVDLGKSWTA